MAQGVAHARIGQVGHRQAIGYSLGRWKALTRYVDDGRLEIDNNAAERALRGVSLGRKNYLFMGSDAGGERAAAFYSLVETAKLNGIDPEGYPMRSQSRWKAQRWHRSVMISAFPLPWCARSRIVPTTRRIWTSAASSSPSQAATALGSCADFCAAAVRARHSDRRLLPTGAAPSRPSRGKPASELEPAIHLGRLHDRFRQQRSLYASDVDVAVQSEGRRSRSV